MSCMTIKYKNTLIDVEFSHNQGDTIDIESIEIGGVDVQYLFDNSDDMWEINNLIREQIYTDL
jgi:hypothetical protein